MSRGVCIRVTISDDLIREETVRTITNALKAIGDKVLVWFSLPCTGGCPYAKVNAGKSQKVKQRLGDHLSLFNVLWRAATRLMCSARELGAVIAVEWLTYCESWKREEVKYQMAVMSYRFLHLHGCMYGLRSTARSIKGRPITKPWTIATDCPTLFKYLERRCLAHWHTDETTGAVIPHASCSGINAKVTEGYTHEFAIAVHNGHKDYVSGSHDVAHCMPLPAWN